MLKGSWKTTAAGLASFFTGLGLLLNILGGDKVDLEKVGASIATIATGVGLMFARDNNKTSEQVKAPGASAAVGNNVEVVGNKVEGGTGSGGISFHFIVAGLGLFFLTGCTHFDVVQSYYDPEIGGAVTNRARGTLFMARNTLDKIDIASRTKTTSSLVRGKGVESSGDAETMKALAEAFGVMAATVAKTAVK